MDILWELQKWGLQGSEFEMTVTELNHEASLILVSPLTVAQW